MKNEFNDDYLRLEDQLKEQEYRLENVKGNNSDNLFMICKIGGNAKKENYKESVTVTKCDITNRSNCEEIKADEKTSGNEYVKRTEY
ncbi:14230_t:CDS:2 [Racocetra fulgida]|uniref:14230_t:CDS:1 n=1 Tax=Racocetra fulgida TaxID=60492 RepID=A0A9N9A371_9GLOM|nr:14230_t:CDS:2 [Racocetra fulgida]